MTGPAPASPATDRVFILGAGRAGRSIAIALDVAGVPVVGLHGRGPQAPPVTSGPLPASLRAASVVLVTVRDEQLDEALAELAPHALAEGAAVLHASGAGEPATLAALRARDVAAGTFHPLVPLAEPAEGAARLRGAWIGVDGDDRARAAARRLAQAIGAHVLDIPVGAKAAYHAAAVFASNFPVVLAAAAAALLREAGVEAGAADGAVRALIAGAVANLRGADVALDATAIAAVLTGPVARGDAGTIAAHLAALHGRGAERDAYVALSRLAVDTLRAAGKDLPRLDDVQRVLDDRARDEASLAGPVSDRR